MDDHTFDVAERPVGRMPISAKRVVVVWKQNQVAEVVRGKARLVEKEFLYDKGCGVSQSLAATPLLS